jgi:Sulfotransferase family
MGDPRSQPIFVVGCHRSGTTLLRLMLDSHPNISCGPETGFLGDFADRLTGDRWWPQMRLYGFPKAYWYERLATLFDSAHSDYARRRGKSRWADKTPRYALALDHITQMFPTCQIVHVIRDGRDVVASHRDRWGYLSAVKAVKKWAVYVRSTRAAAATLPEDRYYEIRYEDLVSDTEGTMRKLLNYLGEPWDDSVIRYDDKPHDVQARYLSFSASRRAAADNKGPVYASRVGSHRRELDPFLRTFFYLVSGRALQELGYR